MTPQVEPMPNTEGRDGHLVRTSYSERFVAELKRVVPAKDREWWPDSKGWWVAGGNLANVLVVLHETFGEYDLINDRTGEVVRYG